VQFNDNVAIVINQEGNPKGTCVSGPITWKLQESNFTQIVFLALKIL
jgi:large subunit ribosomal protein L14